MIDNGVGLGEATLFVNEKAGFGGRRVAFWKVAGADEEIEIAIRIEVAGCDTATAASEWRK